MIATLLYFSLVLQLQSDSSEISNVRAGQGVKESSGDGSALGGALTFLVISLCVQGPSDNCPAVYKVHLIIGW